jgi:hypothetical protein
MTDPRSGHWRLAHAVLPNWRFEPILLKNSTFTLGRKIYTPYRRI